MQKHQIRIKKFTSGLWKPAARECLTISVEPLTRI